MKKAFIAILLLPLVQSGAVAQVVGNPVAGKAYWEREAPRATACRNCHGGMGEGAFGPDLAGRGLNAAQVMQAVRKPWGIMPAFVESQLSDQDAADLAAYFASMPKPAEPGKWRFEAPAGAPPGQAALINIGCGQCHGLDARRTARQIWAPSTRNSITSRTSSTTTRPRWRRTGASLGQQRHQPRHGQLFEDTPVGRHVAADLLLGARRDRLPRSHAGRAGQGRGRPERRHLHRSRSPTTACRARA